MTGNSMIVNQRTVYLFGIDAPLRNPRQAVAARQALDEILSKGMIHCEKKRGWLRGVLATCNANDGSDLALTLLRYGKVTVIPSQIIASPLEEAYISAEAVAREAGKGIWEPENIPSSSPEQALDKVALALATPPNPVRADSWLWYVHPWQSVIAGIMGLIGAALILLVAKYQINAEREKYYTERLDRRRGLLFRYKRDIVMIKRDADYVYNKIVIEAHEKNQYNYAEVIRYIKKYMEFTKIKVPNNFNVSPEEFSIIGYEIGSEIEDILDGIELHNQIFNVVHEMDNDGVDNEKCDEIAGDVKESMEELIDKVGKAKESIENSIKKIDRIIRN
ncbi:hypothetical protein [Azospirillum argentinense]